MEGNGNGQSGNSNKVFLVATITQDVYINDVNRILILIQGNGRYLHTMKTFF